MESGYTFGVDVAEVRSGEIRLVDAAEDWTGRMVMNSPGAILWLIRERRAGTRGELVAATGLARSTVGQLLQPLMDRRLVIDGPSRKSTGGRPATALRFNERAGVVFSADIGHTHTRLAVTDLLGKVLADETGDIDLFDGPETVLGWVNSGFGRLLSQVGQTPDAVLGIGIGIPAPVDLGKGRVSPPAIPDWDDYPIRSSFSSHFPGAPILIDNDANVMALGEHRHVHPDCADMIFVKVGTRIGAGLIVDGRIYRGAQGAAGDVGHTHISEHDGTLCTCGNVGCLETYASGSALARRLSASGVPAAGARDVVTLVRSGNREAIRLVREAGRLLGEILSGVINLLNPSTIVIGGDLASAHEQLVAGAREVIYQRSPPLATRHLVITPSELGDRAGVMGAATMVLDWVLAPEAIDAMLASPIDTVHASVA